MKRFIAILLYFILATGLALGQTGTPQTKGSLNTEVGTNFPDNVSQQITPEDLRQTSVDFIASWQQAPRVNAQTGTTYTISVDDYGKLVTFSNGSSIAVTLPQATTTFSTFNFFACNKGVGTVTITPTTSTINGATTYTLVTNQCTLIVSDATNYQALMLPVGRTSGGSSAPTTQVFTSGTDQTYTKPAGVVWIELYVVGGGGGGGGGGSAGSGNGTNGNPSCWKGSGTACSTPLYQGSGGAGGTSSAVADGGAGGGVAGSATCTIPSTGQGGAGSVIVGGTSAAGGLGGSSEKGGGGVSKWSATGGNGGSPGGGGAGGGANGSGVLSGAGGGGGGTCYVIIPNPSATYVYTVGASAAGGGAGTNGSAGGDGAAGGIYVIEHYGS